MCAESQDLNPTATDGCESYHAHLNAEFYSAQPKIYLLVETLLRQQTSTYISLASLSQSRPVHKKGVRSPHFCDGYTLITKKRVLAACIIPILSCLNVYSPCHDVEHSFFVIFFTHCLSFLPRDAMLSVVYAVVVCLSVCMSVCVSLCLSHSGIVSKRLNVGSRK